MLVTRRESLKISRHNVIGEVWLDLDGGHFPEQGWTDLVAAVLIQFFDALSVLDLQQPEYTVYFFDGPYELRLVQCSMLEIRMEAIRRSKDDAQEIVRVGKESRVELEESVRRAAVDLLAFCRERGYSNSDLERLAEYVGN